MTQTTPSPAPTAPAARHNHARTPADAAWLRWAANRAPVARKAACRLPIETGLKLSGTDVYRASTERSAWYTRLHELFEHYDFVVLPSSQSFPFDAQCHWPAQIGGRAMDTYHRWLEVVIPSSLAGVPTISVPAGFNADGLPMGIQILGKSNADFAVMQLAHRFSVATGHHLSSPASARL